ncbi:two-component system, response regulator RegA [Enhydrobacter aerosaccus]|uniref:Two-component system, response regulator RegA n=1 Tax=Enhydrobacter aerosaccus TaxID=225324 RepID=A0A1T4RRG4_9HYPH|nr:response regulator transcription factor [Enhydrobacter aerosaccus]SKA18416.1 two-component system, response regulator RegA [Enhydrobacter aerosaccus]
MSASPYLLIVDDDASFVRAMRRSFERRGYEVAVCGLVSAVPGLLQAVSPQFAIVDLKLGGESGLNCVRLLKEHDQLMRIVVLTGFASIATAVEAIKLGACHYLAKPANADDIEAAFGKTAGDVSVPLTTRRTTLKTLEWERIHEMLVETEFNVSETARRLGMHRRTLARKLAKRQVV